jgi:exopolyphosphatase / guanosine-5'-triphosphate,3'-diphosphate pyrophosphatase
MNGPIRKGEDKLVFAAIDIGSNAIRLLFSIVFENAGKPIFKKLSLIRVPIRLGEDAFPTGRISVDKALAVIKAMIAFKHLMEIQQPVDYMALATSAIRNAENGPRIVEEIKRQTSLEVEIIDGQREAEIIYLTHVAEEMLGDRSYLYIEVGGGSTEISLFSHNSNVFSRSFPIGAVRMLYNLVPEVQWEELKIWLKARTHAYQPLEAICTGGNINTILKLLDLKEGKTLEVKRLRSMQKYLRSYSVEDRIKVLGLRPDRADVIVPATEIYLSVMKWSGITRMIVPKLGLADGIIHLLYEKYRKNRDLARQAAV